MKKRPTRTAKQDSPQPRLDYVLLEVRLTLAVQSFVCDEHSELAEQAAIESVLEQFAPLAANETVINDDIVVLGSEFRRLFVTKGEQV